MGMIARSSLKRKTVQESVDAAARAKGITDPEMIVDVYRGFHRVVYELEGKLEIDDLLTIQKVLDGLY